MTHYNDTGNGESSQLYYRSQANFTLKITGWVERRTGLTTRPCTGQWRTRLDGV